MAEKKKTANRKHKDTFFRSLFSDKKNLLELFNALAGKVASLFMKIKGFKNIVDIDVIVININKGVNIELERKSKILAGYITFIAKVREYELEHPQEEAMRLAIKYCIENNILREYLIQHSVEVMNMLTAEFNLEEYKKIKYLEGVEDGIEKDKKEGEQKVLELVKQGLSYEEIKKKLEKTSKKNHK